MYFSSVKFDHSRRTKESGRNLVTPNSTKNYICNNLNIFSTVSEW